MKPSKVLLTLAKGATNNSETKLNTPQWFPMTNFLLLNANFRDRSDHIIASDKLRQ